MTGKEYLMQIRNIQVKVNIIRNEIEVIKAKLGYQSPGFDSIGSHPKNSYVEDKTTRLVLRLSEKQKELEEELIKLEEKKTEIKAVLFQLENPLEIEVLYRRYFLCEKWDDIALFAHYSVSYIKKTGDNGCLKIDKLICNE